MKLGTRGSAAVCSVLVMALVVAACSGDFGGGEDAMEAVDDEVSSSTGESGERPADDDRAQPEEAAVDADIDLPQGEVSLPAGERGARHVIRDGRFTVEYPASFDESYSELAVMARQAGGGVVGVRSETDADGRTVGEVSVEVPVDAYDDLLLDVAGLGEVLRRNVTEDDVTDEVTDLRSRLRHLERQEAFYLDLFDDAQDVSDAIMLQEHLARVQEAKEEVQGRLDRLEALTSMSRLSVELVPEGHDVDGVAPSTAGLAGYWDDAVDAFVRVSGTLLVLVVGAAPLLFAAVVPVGLILLAVKALRPRRGGGPPSERSGEAVVASE